MTQAQVQGSVQAQVQAIAGGAIVRDGAVVPAPDESWFDAARWPRCGASALPAGGRGAVDCVVLPFGPCVLRQYRRGGLAARVSANAYLWTGRERTRAFREFRLLARLAALDLPVPRPIAAIYRREGLRYTAALATALIAGATTLAARLASNALDASLARDVGREIARFHAAGVWHADLNAHNILIDPRARVWLIDFDRGRLRRPAWAWQQANLARLRRSLDKLGARRHAAEFEATFWHPLLAAYHASFAATGATARGAGR